MQGILCLQEGGELSLPPTESDDQVEGYASFIRGEYLPKVAGKWTPSRN